MLILRTNKLREFGSWRNLEEKLLAISFWLLAFGFWPTAKDQQPTANSQRPTAKGQQPKTNSVSTKSFHEPRI